MQKYNRKQFSTFRLLLRTQYFPSRINQTFSYPFAFVKVDLDNWKENCSLIKLAPKSELVPSYVLLWANFLTHYADGDFHNDFSSELSVHFNN
jgi:hypothetical protein